MKANYWLPGERPPLAQLKCGVTWSAKLKFRLDDLGLVQATDKPLFSSALRLIDFSNTEARVNRPICLYGIEL